MQTLNIGLASNNGAAPINAVEVLTWLRATGRKQINDARIVQSNTEPTLVVRIDAPLNAAEAYALCAAFDQDCIAQSADGISGALLGPNAAQWGSFNPSYFIQ